MARAVFDETEDQDKDVPRSPYSEYSQALDKFPQLNADELDDLLSMTGFSSSYDSWAQQRLWVEATRVVLYVFHGLRSKGQLPGVAADDMDYIQEGNIAAGSALPRWNPSKGKLTTFLVPRVRGALLNYARRERVAETGLQSTWEPISEEPTGDEYAETQEISLDETLEYPHAVFPQPEDAYRALEAARSVSELSPIARDLLESRIYRDESVAAIAERYGKNQVTIRTKITRSLNLIKRRKCGYSRYRHK